MSSLRWLRQTRYCLLVGDLTIEDVLNIRKAVLTSEAVTKTAKRKVKDQVETLWEAHRSAHFNDILWQERCEALERTRRLRKPRKES